MTKEQIMSEVTKLWKEWNLDAKTITRMTERLEKDLDEDKQENEANETLSTRT